MFDICESVAIFITIGNFERSIDFQLPAFLAKIKKKVWKSLVKVKCLIEQRQKYDEFSEKLFIYLKLWL